MAALDIEKLDVGALTPQEFAQLVAQTPKREMAELMAGEHRRKVLDEVFRRMTHHFRPDKAGSTSAVIHWRIGGRPDGGHDEYEMVIADGACALSPRLEREPRLTVTADAVDFLRLASGNASGATLFLTRKLKLDGDLGLGANLTNLFDIPKA